MKRICIGVHAHEQPEQLRATLESLRRNTVAETQVILLPDGPDAGLKQALPAFGNIAQFDTKEPLGAAACFNRLAANSDAEIVVLLESGARVAPNWLERLVVALDADPANGLAGPSTNHAWNEQGVFPNAGGAVAEIARVAREAAERFGDQCRTLEPLYSLADFCYAVRREVIDEIGAANENYWLGPCWEMDYNIRASRARWRGVWACAAFVWRAPFTARRRLEESRRFETSKRLYQDNFCGARLRGAKADYRSHCRGDECPNFAPAELIRIRQPLPEKAPDLQPPPAVSLQDSSEPLVSLIMPTCDRRSFIPQAVRCFQRQDYRNLELVIVDDGGDPISDCIPEDSRIRSFRLDHKLTTGAKRNFACAQSRGAFIVHWDDDDWYPVWRVRAQVDAMAEHNVDLCGSSQVYYFDTVSECAWRYQYTGSGVAWVAGNTLAYRRSFWEQKKFPDIRVGEDSRFVWGAPVGRIYDLNDPGLCVATAHAGNTSRKETRGSYWHGISGEHIRSLLGDVFYFYRVDYSSPQSPEWPLISCIMPTWNRRRFVPLALRSFLNQDYPNRELIIVDDGAEPVEDLTDGIPNVHYLRLSKRASIGAKRNLACQRARGGIIAHWDDDDWYSPDRLRYQAIPILMGQADLTGLENAIVMQLPGGDFWTTRPELHRKMFVGDVHGGTLVYRRELLDQWIRYPEISLGEDAWLLRRAVGAGKRLARLSNPGVFVYVRHGQNAWQFTPGTFLNPSGWTRIPAPPLFPAGVLDSYKTACNGSKFDLMATSVRTR